MIDQAYCPCGGIILADTEEWKVPRCYECYTEMREPEYDPDAVTYRLSAQEQKRIVSIHRSAGISFQEIADLMNKRGHRTSHGLLFTDEMIRKIDKGSPNNFADPKKKKEMDDRYPDK